MKPRFQIDPEGGESSDSPSPEKYDAQNGNFAANPEVQLSPGNKFIVEEAPVGLRDFETATPQGAGQSQDRRSSPTASEEFPATSTPGAGECWRDEVAARVKGYRERRGAPQPHYPSLRLKFEGFEPSWRSSSAAEAIRVSAEGTGALSVAVEQLASKEKAPALTQDAAKVIEFPRPPLIPRITDELAEPILDRPRIMEAPELLPLPPALGGISIDQAEPVENDQKFPIEVPLRPASITRRLLATVSDGLIVLAASAMFAYVLFRITVDSSLWARPNLILGALPVLFWFAYHYLFSVYCGRTPGTALMRMHLQTFSGGAAPRPLRRWRVLASVLSAVSLCLGYAWCFMDEDQLCWHDRITHTYLAPRN